MNIQQKLRLLDGMYRVYDEFIQSQTLACERFCTDCCTCNMTLTTLEGYRILSSLEDAPQRKLLNAIQAASGRQRFLPKLTTNLIAKLCMDDKQVPEEPMDPDWGACPVLENQECPIYPERPFGCRCMVSKVRCNQTGYAHIDGGEILPARLQLHQRQSVVEKIHLQSTHSLSLEKQLEQP